MLKSDIKYFISADSEIWKYENRTVRQDSLKLFSLKTKRPKKYDFYGRNGVKYKEIKKLDFKIIDNHLCLAIRDSDRWLSKAIDCHSAGEKNFQGCKRWPQGITVHSPMWLGPPPALYPDLHLRLASTALQGFLEWRAGSDIQSSGPMCTRSRCENCLAKSSKLIQNSPSFLTRTLSSSLSLSLRESHSQLLSDQGPFHSPRPQGLRSLT